MQWLKDALLPFGQCKVCKRISGVLESSREKWAESLYVKLGAVAEVLTSTCDQHRVLFEALRDELDLESRNGVLFITKDYWTERVTFVRRKDSNDREFDESASYSGSFDWIGGNGLGVHLTSPWIDEAILQRWYEDCVDGHGCKCTSPDYLETMAPSEPRYFIDLHNHCLAEAPTGAPYAALSYVWGKSDMIKTTSSNLAHLKRPGALEEPDVRQDLPRTIQHAMYLMSRLRGLRYLWIDALCIVQDDEVMLRFHLPQMGSIYAGAEVVIINIDGTTANHGLRGLERAPEAVPRHIDQSLISFRNLSFVRPLDIGRESSRSGPYYSRGWTFQEDFFARRRIVFEDDSVWFGCCSGIHVEDHAKPVQPREDRDWMLDSPYPSITVLSDIIQDFNTRQFTYAQDCLAAFAGTVSCLEKQFPGGFICGLPVMFIDAMLLWQPKGDIIRRKASDHDDRGPMPFEMSCLPSWSWAGWQGLIDFDGWHTANSFLRSCSGRAGIDDYHIIPTVTWSAAPVQNDISGQKIECTWAQWRERFRDSDAQLPKGWSRRRIRKNERCTFSLPPRGYGKFAYRFGEKRGPEYYYPIPLVETDRPPTPDPISPYLFAEVETAHAYILGETRTSTRSRFWAPYDRSYVVLNDAVGDPIGRLILHSADYLQKQGITVDGQQRRIQLISISEGSVSHDIQYSPGYVDEYGEEPWTTGGSSYDFHNVLWISWDNGVARREALGRVKKSDWEDLRPERISICLN